MGMPKITITFTDAAKSLVYRAENGIVGLILKDVVPTTNPLVVTEASEIPSTVSTESATQIKAALKGRDKSPKSVVAYFVGKTAEDYTAALNYFETEAIDYLAAPTATTDGQVDAIKTWVIDQRTNSDSVVVAVLPNCEADNEGIVNFATESCMEGDTTYTAEQMCARVAGILASTKLTQSCTYAELPELTGCTRLTETEMDEAVEAGKLIAFWDGEKVKLGRGVNSLVTLNGKSEQWKKIRVVHIMDLIKHDIKKIGQDNFIGKYSNSYDNKCILIGSILTYFNWLISESALTSATVDIDIAAVKEYLTANGVDVSSLKDQEIKEYPTGDKVFLTATIQILDAIEDIILPITI